MKISFKPLTEFGNYQIIGKVEKTSCYSTYHAKDSISKAIHVLKAFDIPRKELLFVQKYQSLLPCLKELPDNISYQHIEYYHSQQQILLFYQPQIPVTSSLKNQFLSQNKTFNPKEALNTFVLILENYIAILRRTNKPFTLLPENIIEMEGNLSIDYLSAYIQDLTSCQKCGLKNHIKKSIGMLFYRILYPEQFINSFNEKCCICMSQIKQFNKIYDLYGLNSAIKLLLNDSNEAFFECIFKILEKFRFYMNTREYKQQQHTSPQLKNLEYLLEIPDKQYFENFSIRHFQIYLEKYAYYGNYYMVLKILIQLQNSRYLKELNGRDIAYQAVQQNQLKIFTRLLQCFDINKCDLANFMILASQLGHFSLFKYLITECRINAKYFDSKGQNALLISAQNGHIEIFKYLIEEVKVDPNLSDKWRLSSLMYSAQKGHLEIVKYLIKEIKVNPNQVDNSQNTSLILGAINGHFDIVKYLIQEEKIDPNEVNYSGKTPLLGACICGNLQMAKFLIEKAKVNPNHADCNGDTPLLISASEGHLDIVKYLIEEVKQNPNQSGQNNTTVLFKSAKKGRLEVVKYLILEAGVDPNQSNKFKDTALSLSALNGHLEVVKFLIQVANVNPNYSSTTYQNPLLSSAERGYPEIVKFLIEETDADLNLISPTGGNFLQIIKYDCPQIIKLIFELQKQVNLSATNHYGQTLKEVWKQKKFYKALDILESL